MDEPHSDGDEAAYFVEAADGRIAFTALGHAYYAAYFAFAGIDLRTIKTTADLLRAERAAFPAFDGYLLQRLRSSPHGLERRALRAIVQGDDAAFERALRQLETRRRLRVL
jgi:hypothetical protein